MGYFDDYADYVGGAPQFNTNALQATGRAIASVPGRLQGLWQGILTDDAQARTAAAGYIPLGPDPDSRTYHQRAWGDEQAPSAEELALMRRKAVAARKAMATVRDNPNSPEVQEFERLERMHDELRRRLPRLTERQAQIEALKAQRAMTGRPAYDPEETAYDRLDRRQQEERFRQQQGQAEGVSEDDFPPLSSEADYAPAQQMGPPEPGGTWAEIVERARKAQEEAIAARGSGGGAAESDAPKVEVGAEGEAGAEGQAGEPGGGTGPGEAGAMVWPGGGDWTPEGNGGGDWTPAPAPARGSGVPGGAPEPQNQPIPQAKVNIGELQELWRAAEQAIPRPQLPWENARSPREAAILQKLMMRNPRVAAAIQRQIAGYQHRLNSLYEHLVHQHVNYKQERSIAAQKEAAQNRQQFAIEQQQRQQANRESLLKMRQAHSALQGELGRTSAAERARVQREWAEHQNEIKNLNKQDQIEAKQTWLEGQRQRLQIQREDSDKRVQWRDTKFNHYLDQLRHEREGILGKDPTATWENREHLATQENMEREAWRRTGRHEQRLFGKRPAGVYPDLDAEERAGPGGKTPEEQARNFERDVAEAHNPAEQPRPNQMTPEQGLSASQVSKEQVDHLAQIAYTHHQGMSIDDKFKLHGTFMPLMAMLSKAQQEKRGLTKAERAWYEEYHRSLPEELKEKLKLKFGSRQRAEDYFSRNIDDQVARD